jgi:hypothetical protein
MSLVWTFDINKIWMLNCDIVMTLVYMIWDDSAGFIWYQMRVLVDKTYYIPRIHIDLAL